MSSSDDKEESTASTSAISESTSSSSTKSVHAASYVPDGDVSVYYLIFVLLLLLDLDINIMCVNGRRSWSFSHWRMTTSRPR